MPELQPTTLRRIDWAECFPFIQIFRAFKLAIHPGRLGVALAAVVLTGVLGWVLDALWGGNRGPLPGEIQAYSRVHDLQAWREGARRTLAEELRTAATEAGVPVTSDLVQGYATDPAGTAREVIDRIITAGREALSREAAGPQGGGQSASEQRAALAAEARRYQAAYAMARAAAPTGIFRGLVSYEFQVIRQFTRAACELNIAGGLNDALARRGDLNAIRWGLDASDWAGRSGDPPGMLACVLLGLRGLQWLFTEHPFYTLLFGLSALAIWSLAGGAVCRMAAMSFARQEHISMRIALAFALRKLAGLYLAPLFPVILIVGVGACMILGGLIVAIPGLGEILFPLFALLAIPGGLIIAGVGIGALAGGSLMWPTIAVEGSDSFDAMSRTYSYIYTRPWKAAFYGLVLAIYAAICYLFVRLFLLIAIQAIRFFFGIGLLVTSRPQTGDPEGSKLAVLWPAPSFDHLRGALMPIAAQPTEMVGAWGVTLVVLLLVAALYAFLAALWLSGSTIIYCLLRREVDATDYEDIYLEEEEEESNGPLEVGAPASGPQGAAPPAGSAPPETPATTSPAAGPAGGGGAPAGGQSSVGGQSAGPSPPEDSPPSAANPRGS